MQPGCKGSRYAWSAVISRIVIVNGNEPNYVPCDLVNEFINNENTDERKASESFNSTLEIVNIVMEVSKEVKEIAEYLDDGHEGGTYDVQEVEHGDAGVEA